MKNTKFIAILMAVLILVSSSGVSFVFAAGETEGEAYNLGYNKGKAEALGKISVSDMPNDQIIKDGYGGDNKEKYLEGYKTAYIKAINDQVNAYNEGYNLAQIEAEYISRIPDDGNIMLKHSGEYKGMFLNGYKQGFVVAKATLGMKLGKLVGEFYGARDYIRGIPSDWYNSIPSNSELVTSYNLDLETDGYKAKFFEDFRAEFEKAYKDGYEKANLDPNIISKEAGNRDGGAVGEVLGEMQGKKDFKDGLTSYFKRFMPSEVKIALDYELDNVNNVAYKRAFITSFNIAYELNYERAYREASLEDKEGKAYRQGYDEGVKDGKSTGEWHYNNGGLVPIENVRPTDEKVRINYDSQISIIDPIYKDDFVKGYQSGFTIGYESIDVLMTERLDGFNKGYNDGKVLAAENNANKKFLDYDDVKLLPYEIMGNNYEYLKDKGFNYINNFVIGYQEGYEKGYNEIIKKSDAEGSKDGAVVGAALGEMLGKQDFEAGKESNFALVMPSDANIKEYYKLGNINNIAYENSFIVSFKIAFESSYDRAYKEANLDDKQAFNHGYILGVEDGEAKGLESLVDGKLLPIEKVRLTSAQIKALYSSKLTGKSPIYVDEFIKGYQSGFTSGYESISTSVSERLDGYNIGYEYGKQLAGENNAIRKFTPYSDLAILTSEQIMRNNYDYLKNKDSSFIDNFVDGYKEGYEKGYKEIIKKSAVAGTEYGKIAGEVLGETLGKNDSEDKKENNPTLAMPSYSEIVERYELDKFNDVSYQDAFVTSFRTGFMTGYEKGYVEVIEEGDAAGSSDGRAAGTSLGDAFGKKDFKDGKPSDFAAVMPDDAKIATDYELNKINNPAYKAAFISSFKIAFELNYDKAYKDANMDDKEGQGYKQGYSLGIVDGKEKGEEVLKGGLLIPVDQVKLTTTQIKAKHATELTGKDNIFIDEFIKGYQDGFKFGYDGSNISIIEEADGFSRGYSDGRSLAAENNKNENYLSYDKVTMTDYQVMGKNYEYLKDKGTDFIVNFVKGYQKGFEKGYKEVIKFNEEDEEDITAISSNFGASFGLLYGEIEGIRDYERGAKPDWYRALPKDSEIISRFSLSNLPRSERDEFLDKFTLNFQIGYEKAYYNANFGLVRDNLNAGKMDGALFGASLGKINGTRDYFDKRNSDYNRDMPSERMIRSDYSLRRDDELYESGFVSSFMKAYQEAYIKAFRDASKNDVIRDGEYSEANGLEVGLKMGEMQAVSDYLQQKTNDWKRSIPAERTIISDYNLTLLSEKYRAGFISAFYDGYSKGYNDKFKEFAQGNAVNKSNSEMIPLKGGSLNSLDGAFNLNIEAGTYYHPVHLTLNTMYNYNSLFPSTFIKASDSYSVNVLNTSQNMDNKKLIEIQFEYYGDKIRGGIYKYVGNKWVYLPTKIENGYMTTLVTPSQINGTYSAFVNTNIVIFPDARGHWAKDEINALIRRSIISGYSDNTFKPDRNISRAEFLTLLSRAYDWNMYYYTGNATAFKDAYSFGGSSNIINYATSMGYISGYPDGTFKPNNPISYREVEIIMSRIAYGVDSSWSTYATKMQYEKKVKSASLINMNNKITRAEVVYMLYIANQGKY